MSVPKAFFPYACTRVYVCLFLLGIYSVMKSLGIFIGTVGTASLEPLMAPRFFTVPTGVPVRVLCDLTEFSAAAEINYTAVTVRCDSAASMDIQKIECCSHVYSDGELAELYRHRETRYEVENEIRVRSMSRAQWAVCILIGMGTVTAVALLSRRDKEKE